MIFNKFDGNFDYIKHISTNAVTVQSANHAYRNEQPFCSSIQTDLGVAVPVQMILRLGYVDEYGANCGLRRNLSDYIELVK